jgi:flavodoxin
MKTIIIYDSQYGNTKAIANAIAEGAGANETINVSETDSLSADQLSGLNLLIAGAPTQKFTATPAVKDFINNLPNKSLKNVKVATFDTRIDLDTIKSSTLRYVVKKGGYAAKPLLKRLKKKGGEPVENPMGFMVLDQEGPLKTGELERATEWGKKLLDQLKK